METALGVFLFTVVVLAAVISTSRPAKKMDREARRRQRAQREAQRQKAKQREAERKRMARDYKERTERAEREAWNRAMTLSIQVAAKKGLTEAQFAKLQDDAELWRTSSNRSLFAHQMRLLRTIWQEVAESCGHVAVSKKLRDHADRYR